MANKLDYIKAKQAIENYRKAHDDLTAVPWYQIAYELKKEYAKEGCEEGYIPDLIRMSKSLTLYLGGQ